MTAFRSPHTHWIIIEIRFNHHRLDHWAYCCMSPHIYCLVRTLSDLICITADLCHSSDSSVWNIIDHSYSCDCSHRSPHIRCIIIDHCLNSGGLYILHHYRSLSQQQLLPSSTHTVQITSLQTAPTGTHIYIAQLDHCLSSDHSRWSLHLVPIIIDIEILLNHCRLLPQQWRLLQETTYTLHHCQAATAYAWS